MGWALGVQGLPTFSDKMKKLIDNITKHYISTCFGLVIMGVTFVLFCLKQMELVAWLSAMGVGFGLFIFNEDWLKNIFNR